MKNKTKQKYRAKCRVCEKEEIVEAFPEDMQKWRNKEGFIQDLMPYLDAAQRELLISGTCGSCFNHYFKEE